jgi:hypothetical protein
VELTHPLAPPPMSSWARALKKVIRQDTIEGNKAKHAYDVYNFPDPGLFLSTQTSERGVHYMKNWLRSRYTWLWRASRPNCAPQPLSSQLWRECLFHGFANGTKTDIGDRASQRIQKMLKTFGCSLNAHGFLVVDSDGGQTTFYSFSCMLYSLSCNSSLGQFVVNFVPYHHVCIVIPIIFSTVTLFFKRSISV